jgi:hypothetical protein
VFPRGDLNGVQSLKRTAPALLLRMMIMCKNKVKKMRKLAKNTPRPRAIECRHCHEFYVPLPPDSEPHRTGQCTK